MSDTLRMTKALIVCGLLFLLLFTVIGNIAGQTCGSPPSGLIGWWDADSVVGTTAVDVSGNGNDGTIGGNVTLVSGFVGNAFSFDGTSGTHVYGAFTDFSADTPITMTAWLNQPSVPTTPLYQGIIGVGDRFYDPPNQHFFLRSSARSNGADSEIWQGTVNFPNGGDGQNRIWLGADDDDSTDRWWGSNTVITQNVWIFVAATWDPSTSEARIYVNGSLDRAQTLSAPLSLKDKFWIGGDAYAPAYNDNWYNGLIDEIQVFNRALTSAEIQELYYSYFAQEVVVDIMPGSCQNPLNIKSKGVLPVAIYGSDGLAAVDIDVASIRLEGVAPVRSGIEDIGSAMDIEYCEEYGSDGYDDLTLKFKTQEIIDALGDLEDGDEISLCLSGTLTDGTRIEGPDIVTIIK